MGDSLNVKNLHLLKNLLGEDLFLTVADILAGQRVSFPKRIDSLDKAGRNRAILKDYDAGVKISDLMQKYELEQSQIYKIIEKTSLL